VPLALLVRVGWRLRWAAHTLGLGALHGHLARLAAAGLCGLGGLMLGLRWHPLAALALAALGYLIGLRLAGVIDNHPLRQWQTWRASAPSNATN
jgi:hypothetical protein